MHLFSRLICPILLSIVLLPNLTLRADEAPKPGAIDDPNILYVGRWDAPNNGVRYGYWSGVYLRAVFTGKNVSIRLAGPTALAVCIDGGAPREVFANTGLTALNDKPLDDKDHTLQVGSAGQNYEVAFQGLNLDDQATTKPVAQRPLIEFIGDSITQGNESYAWRCSQMLGCDHVQIAFSGVALTDGYGCSTKVGMAVQYFQLKNFNHTKEPSVPWTFTYTPQIIVINLGQNDQCGQEPANVMTASYLDFVQKLRAKFPQTKIVAMRTYGGPFAAAEKAAVQKLTDAGDADLIFVDTTGWLSAGDFGDGIHPNYDGSIKAGRLLANELAPLLGK